MRPVPAHPTSPTPPLIQPQSLRMLSSATRSSGSPVRLSPVLHPRRPTPLSGLLRRRPWHCHGNKCCLKLLQNEYYALYKELLLVSSPMTFPSSCRQQRRRAATACHRPNLQVLARKLSHRKWFMNHMVCSKEATKRNAWAGTFQNYLKIPETPRTDCQELNIFVAICNPCPAPESRCLALWLAGAGLLYFLFWLA